MSLPAPQAGLVVRYSYLWKREALAGREEGVKDRPCAVILVIFDERGRQRVRVLPITHTPPADPADALEIPLETKRRLGLDLARSWIVVSEANDFLWPGPDIRPLAGHGLESAVYGFLPPSLFRALRNRIAARGRTRGLVVTPRTE